MKKVRATLVVDPTKQSPARRVLVSLSWYSVSIHRGISRYANQAHWNLDLSNVHDSLLPDRWGGTAFYAQPVTTTPLTKG